MDLEVDAGDAWNATTRDRVRRRERRGRTPRGPGVLPSPLAPEGVPGRLTGRARFDRVATRVLADIEHRLDPDTAQRLGSLTLAVEDVPILPLNWRPDQVPLSSLVREPGRPVQIVLFRRPLEHRASSGEDLTAVVLMVLVEQVAELLGCRPEDLHPAYPRD